MQDTEGCGRALRIWTIRVRTYSIVAAYGVSGYKGGYQVKGRVLERGL
jgi:hypothetical protein